MDLLYVHGTYLDSGKANVVQAINMCQAFSGCGADVTFVIAAPKTSSADAVSFITDILGERPNFRIATYIKVTLGGRAGVLGNYLALRSVIDRSRADICFMRDPLVLHLAMKSGLPSVFESHNSSLHNRYRLLAKLWETSVLKDVRNPRLLKFIAISHALGNIWHKKGVPDGKILVLHDGFNPRVFGVRRDRLAAREIVHLPAEGKIVVYAGSLGPDRGVERIISLAKCYQEALFLVLGGPENRRNHYAKLSSQEGVRNILWLGHIPHSQVPPYLQAADVLLMLWTWSVPTINVCSPIKVFEYMAAGRPIVGEAFPTIGEILRDGETAYLADPGSYDMLSYKLGQALQEPSTHMVERARDLAFDQYTWDSRARHIIESLKQI